MAERHHPAHHVAHKRHPAAAKKAPVDSYLPSRAKISTAPHAQTLQTAVRQMQRPAAPISVRQPLYIADEPKHPKSRLFFFFIVAVIVGIALSAIIFDLLVDSGLLQAPIQVPTNFFN